MNMWELTLSKSSAIADDRLIIFFVFKIFQTYKCAFK